MTFGMESRAAADRGADLVVMGTHGRGVVGHLLLGSVAERVIRLAHCPVRAVRDFGAVRPSAPALAYVRREPATHAS